MTDPLYWMQHLTRTRDSHWREAGANSPYRSFPDKPYFPPLVECFHSEPVVFIEKSRDLMLSWFSVGFFSHDALGSGGILQPQSSFAKCEDPFE